ncbi:protein kinase [Actinomadura sp. 21ATH]|uniref:serine/threonine-protein kinase n=1 Tax=Actinomadura sp. 21ATH TaxID=1735444 RepID=UPI0035C01A30
MRAGMELDGRYRLAERIGRGGMGEVWRAKDLRLGRAVAVKVLPAIEDVPDAQERFRREAMIAARLRHPGITVVHDTGRHEDRPFIVMELLEGTDLAAVLAGAPEGLPVGRAVSLAAEAADALAAAHGERIVHRDLKPANLFLGTDGRLKICDFGIARAADAGGRLTAEGSVVGTVAYMSPEQCRGEDVDERSDLYSLGCVLHEMLTGVPPFPPGPPHVLLLHHLHSVPEGPRALRQEVPPELDRLVLALLAKEPAERPAGAAHLALLLRGLGRSGPAPVDDRDEGVAAGAGVDVDVDVDEGPADPAPGDLVLRLFDEAVVLSVTEDLERPGTVGMVGAAMLETDQGRARALLREVARDSPAGFLPPDDETFAVTMAGVDAELAVEWARATEYPPTRAILLGLVAAGVARTDPAWAGRIAGEAGESVPADSSGYPLYRRAIFDVLGPAVDADVAEEFLGAIDDPGWRAEASHAVTVATAAERPEHAERVARSIAAEPRRAEMLTALAAALATARPDDAERIARSVPDVSRGLDVHGPHTALEAVAAAVAPTDPERADRIVGSVLYMGADLWRARELGVALAPARPLRAEQIARAAPSYVVFRMERIRTLAAVGAALAATDPERGGRLIDEAFRTAGRNVRPAKRVEALGIAAAEIAAVRPDRAEEVAGTLRSRSLPFGRNEALHAIAVALVPVAPDRAERVARGIADQELRDRALTRLALGVGAADPGRAERWARDIEGVPARAKALARLAHVLGGHEPNWRDKALLED